jgi:ankyrin repeat protein
VVNSSQAENGFKQFIDGKIGPVLIRSILVGSGFLFVLLVVGALIGGITPYISQMRFGAGRRLIEALEEKRFDEARLMIEEGKGIDAVNEFNQNALLISLEAGRMDLAVLLIRAGADVNIKSKMLMTPLRVAAEAGSLETVNLLLEKGAWPQHPDDRVPPFLYAMVNGHDEIARLLIEAGTDLHRRYPLQGRTGTVGDFAVLAGKQELVELIRRRGGSFSQ